MRGFQVCRTKSIKNLKLSNYTFTRTPGLDWTPPPAYVYILLRFHLRLRCLRKGLPRPCHLWDSFAHPRVGIATHWLDWYGYDIEMIIIHLFYLIHFSYLYSSKNKTSKSIYILISLSLSLSKKYSQHIVISGSPWWPWHVYVTSFPKQLGGGRGPGGLFLVTRKLKS